MVYCSCSPLFLAMVSLWYALNFRVILDCSECHPVKFWISARVEIPQPHLATCSSVQQPSLWDFFFFYTVFSSSSTLALNFLGVSCECYISTFYYTLPKVWIWLLYINILDSLRQQVDASSALLHSEFASWCSSCYVIVQPPNCFDGAPRCLLSSSSAVLRGSALDMALELYSLMVPDKGG